MNDPQGIKTLPLDPKEFVQIITRTTGDAIVTIDEGSTILFANSAVERIFGYLSADLVGESLNLLMPEYLRLLHERAVARYLTTGKRHVDWNGTELPGLHRDGHEIMLEVSFGESLSNGRHTFTGIIRDISDRKAQEAALRERDAALEQLNARLLHVALHDSLTGLPNRVLLIDRLEQVLRRRKDDSGHDAALLFLDFDRFKIVNDSLGHAVGDALLIAISESLTRVVRPEDTVARIGGDEFVILLDHVDSQKQSVQLAERLEATFEQPLSAAGHPLYTSASTGIVPSMFGYDQADAVLRDADMAMYEAKNMGRGCYKVFDAGMREQAVAKMDLATDLRKALQRDEFRVLYAPIHQVATGALLGFEALVQWEHPQRGPLPASAFLPIARELGLMRQIDQMVWEEAGRDMSDLRARFDRPMVLSLNFSRQHFLSPKPEKALLDVLRRTGAGVDQTIIELDEGALNSASDKVPAALEKLASQGVRVHLDNFGTHHASLYDLHRFRVNTLKIDKGIVASMISDPANAELVRVTIGLARNLGLDVIAEGVEDELQLERLKELNCAYAQGYLFSPPLTAQGAARHIEAQHGTPATDAED